METALVGQSLHYVLQKLSEMLKRKGFIIVALDEERQFIEAYRKGNWFTHSKNVYLELSSMEANITRIDITAKIENGKEERTTEEIIEEDICKKIYSSL